MRLSLKDLRGVVAGESGAVTVDWMALAAAIVVIGVGLGYAIFGAPEDAVDGLIADPGAELSEAADGSASALADGGAGD